MSSPITGEDFDNQALSDSLCSSFQEKLLNNGSLKLLLDYLFNSDGTIASTFAVDLIELLPAIGSMEWRPIEESGLDPEVWLKAEGQQVSQTTYARLFAKWGHAFAISGDANTGTLFRVPDMRSRFPLGAGTGTSTAADVTNGTVPDIGAVVGAKAGSKSKDVTLSSDNVPPHRHDISVSGGGVTSDEQIGDFGSITWHPSDAQTLVGRTRLNVPTGTGATPVTIATVPPYFAGIWLCRANLKIGSTIL